MKTICTFKVHSDVRPRLRVRLRLRQIATLCLWGCCIDAENGYGTHSLRLRLRQIYMLNWRSCEWAFTPVCQDFIVDLHNLYAVPSLLPYFFKFDTLFGLWQQMYGYIFTLQYEWVHIYIMKWQLKKFLHNTYRTNFVVSFAFNSKTHAYDNLLKNICWFLQAYSSNSNLVWTRGSTRQVTHDISVKSCDRLITQTGIKEGIILLLHFC